MCGFLKSTSNFYFPEMKKSVIITSVRMNRTSTATGLLKERCRGDSHVIQAQEKFNLGPLRHKCHGRIPLLPIFPLCVQTIERYSSRVDTEHQECFQKCTIMTALLMREVTKSLTSTLVQSAFGPVEQTVARGVRACTL